MGWDKVGWGAGREILHLWFFFPIRLFSNATQVLPACCKALWSAKVLPKVWVDLGKQDGSKHGCRRSWRKTVRGLEAETTDI